VRSFLTLLLLSALGCSAQPVGKWCANDDSGYKDVIATSIAGLRWSLFAISMAADARQIPPEILPRITDASVISIANTLSLRANYLLKCDMEQKEYFRQLDDNQSFGSALLHITSSDKFPVGPLIREKQPALFLSGDPVDVLAGKQVPLQTAIVRRLNQVRQESFGKRTDSYFIAAGQLLGDRNATWDEREIQAVVRIPANNKGPFYRKSFKETLGIIDGRNPLELLEEASHYYVTLGNAPLGIPPSVAHGK
jgi:hypothetical protein